MEPTRRTGFRPLLLAVLCAATSVAGAQTYEVFHSFVAPGGDPTSRLLAAPTGVLYGTTWDAGLYGFGSVFALLPDGAGGFTYQTLHSFVGPDGAGQKNSTLVFGADGNLYGSTFAGGAAGVGTLFRVSPSGDFTRLHDFADGGGVRPSELFLASDGALYGTAREGGAHGDGTVFRLGPDGAFWVVHDFDASVEGAQPLCGFMQSGPFLLGTTNLGGASGLGTIYRINVATGELSTLHEFDGTYGAYPQTPPAVASDGYFYGTAIGGGNGFGTVYRMDAAGAMSVVYAFTYGTDGRWPIGPPVPLSDGKLYAVTQEGGGPSAETYAAGSVFRVDPLGNFETLTAFWVQAPPCPPGFCLGNAPHNPPPSPAHTPVAGLVDGHDGFLYGTLLYPLGGVFRISPSDPQSLTYPHVFGNSEGPYDPRSPLVEANGALYTTSVLSANGLLGSILRFDGSRMSVLHDFDTPGWSGANPIGGLLLASDGGLYGTTEFGGTVGGAGTVYRLTAAGAFESVHSLRPWYDGSNTSAGVIESPAGQFWGVTPFGGGGNMGTVFVEDGSGNMTAVHAFGGPDGNSPRSTLVAGQDGKLYGTTYQGGPSDYGTIFSIDSVGTFANLYNFDNQSIGAWPVAGLVLANDGNFYGAATRGGAANAGFLYRFDGAAVAPVHEFAGTDGTAPQATPIQASDGKLYGTTYYDGANGYGTIFRVDASGNNFETLHDFAGGHPQASLMQASDGAFYSTAEGGYANGGVIYRLLTETAAPALSGTEPTSGRAAGGTLLAVIGSHLTDVSGVSIGGIPATPPAHLDQGSVYTVSPPLTPGTLNDVTIDLPGSSLTLPAAWFADFNDVAGDDIFHDYVEKILRSGITAGCGNGNYCRNDAVRRDQMAVFLLKSEHGSSYVPPACAGIFADVGCPGPFTDWVEQIAAEGVTAGCGVGNYCPGQPVTRAQMAVFLLKTKEGSGYTPPPAAGIFGDVPQANPFAAWIEELANRGITGGCQDAPPLYCPANPNTRGQMAVFLAKTFGL